MTSDLFAGTYARGGAAEAVTAEAWVRAMVDVEAALAAACVVEGLISPQAGQAILRAFQQGPLDVEAIAAEAAENATPVIPLVRQLRERVGPEFADAVHLGATSQDIVDTAAMLVAQRALVPILADAGAGASAAAALAVANRSTPMVGRTLLQQALPTSFGLVAAEWLVGLEQACVELERVRDAVLAVQMGGPVGTRSPQVASRVAATLGLTEPLLPWHTDRTRLVQLAAALGALAGTAAKVARDVSLLAQTEVGELREGREARGGSSAMAHKRNPVAAVSVLACAHRVPGLVATLFAGMEQELQRAAGAWQAEWGTLSELLTLTGSAAAWLADLLTDLEVDTERMRENLETLGCIRRRCRGCARATSGQRGRAGRPSAVGAPTMSPVLLNHTISGPPDGPVLLLGPSLGTNLSMWEPQVAALSDHFRVVAFDHRGHGGSPVPPRALHDRRARWGRGCALGPSGHRACLLRRYLDRRDGRHLAGGQRADSRRPPGADVHIRLRPAGVALDRARRRRTIGGNHRGDCRCRGRTLVHAGVGAKPTHRSWPHTGR